MGYDYYAIAQAQIDAYKANIERWKKDAQKADSPTMREYYEEIQDLESKCSAAEIALNTCRFASQEQAEGLLAQLEESLGELEEALGHFRKRLARRSRRT